MSITHSCIYLALLYAAFVAGKPEPATFILGLAHGLLWIGMSLVCLWAVRVRGVPLRVAVAVAVLGGLGPFVGSYEFVREGRRRAAGGAPRPDRDPARATLDTRVAGRTGKPRARR